MPIVDISWGSPWRGRLLHPIKMIHHLDHIFGAKWIANVLIAGDRIRDPDGTTRKRPQPARPPPERSHWLLRLRVLRVGAFPVTSQCRQFLLGGEDIPRGIRVMRNGRYRYVRSPRLEDTRYRRGEIAKYWICGLTCGRGASCRDNTVIIPQLRHRFQCVDYVRGAVHAWCDGCLDIPNELVSKIRDDPVGGWRRRSSHGDWPRMEVNDRSGFYRLPSNMVCRRSSPVLRLSPHPSPRPRSCWFWTLRRYWAVLLGSRGRRWEIWYNSGRAWRGRLLGSLLQWSVEDCDLRSRCRRSGV